MFALLNISSYRKFVVFCCSEEPFPDKWKPSVYEVKETKDSVIYRVDFPGCPASASDLTYWLDGNNVHFFADEPVMSDYDSRKYGVTMVFNPVAYNVKEATAKLRDGVLWITVPKSPRVNVKLTIIEKMLNCRIT